MRVLEGARLRVKDVEFSRKEILVRDGKGYKDRVTMLPLALVNPLKDHLKCVKDLHEKSWRKASGKCTCPMRWRRNIQTRRRSGCGSMCFPQRSVPSIRARGEERRHHVQDQAIQRAIKQAVREASLTKAATPHTLPFVCDAFAARRL